MISKTCLWGFLLSFTLPVSVCFAGVTIAMQDFETQPLAYNGAVPNYPFGSPNAAGVGYQNDFRTLGWTAEFSSGGSRNREAIGVTNNSLRFMGGSTNYLTNAGNSSDYYIVTEPEAPMKIKFDGVNTSGYTNLELSFDWANSTTSFEADYMSAFINGNQVFGASGGRLTNGSQRGSFITQTLNLSAYDGQVVNVTFEFDSDSNLEAFGIDNITLKGTPTAVPEPSHFAAMGILSLLISLLAWRNHQRKTATRSR